MTLKLLNFACRLKNQHCMGEIKVCNLLKQLPSSLVPWLQLPHSAWMAEVGQILPSVALHEQDILGLSEIFKDVYPFQLAIGGVWPFPEMP